MIDIDWANFTPFHSLFGGVLIGFSAILLMFLNGRILGISGILSGVISNQNIFKIDWKIIFIFGVLLGPIIYLNLFGEFQSHLVAQTPLLILSGFLVGLGTAIGNGCTSGHGICGLARLSSRSLVATFTFVIIGMITVFCLGKVL